MKKLYVALTFTLLFLAGTSTARAGSPVIWGPNQAKVLPAQLLAPGTGTITGGTTQSAAIHAGLGQASAGTAGSVARIEMAPYGHTSGPWVFWARDTAGSAYIDLRYGETTYAITAESGNGYVGIAKSAPTVPLHVGGNALFEGTLTGDGGDALSGFLQKQTASTTVALTAAQCGETLVSNSADVMTLPEASTVLGCRYTFVCGTADDFDVNPADGTDQIGPALNSVAGGTGSAITPAAGDAIRCTDIGSSIILEAVGANLWAPIGVGNGAWTDVN